MEIKKTLTTKNKSSGVNTCELIILHHTATGEGTIKWVLNTLTNGAVSCHYVVDTNGDIYKIGNDKDILWHAGTSSWGKYKNLNSFSIGIEIIGPLANGGFTDNQRESVKNLVLELSKKYAIPKENILRHKDITTRKVDLADSFWNGSYKTFSDYKDSLFFKKNTMSSKYTKIMENALKETGFKPIFGTHEGTETLTEQEVKELMEVYGARLYKRIKDELTKI